MKIEQIYTNCLAEAAYYIESNGEVAIIDPLREPTPYIEKAKENNAKIKYVFETHFHADFVSGHIDLAKETGATIIYGPGAETKYEIHEATDNETFTLGNVKIKALHTPGHTLESTTYLLIDENGKEHAIFTGDTLFIGDVGRPDLAIKSDLTQNDLAGMLFESLRNKIMPLPNDVIVYPAHGAGSACGKNMSSETSSTLGEQKANNYALQDISKEEFITQLTTGILSAPQYFAKNATLNKNGYNNYKTVKEKGLKALTTKEVIKLIDKDVLVLDTRKPQLFKDAFIPQSINIGLDGSFAVWVGTLITDMEQPIVIIVEEGREEEAIERLARVGYDNVVGYLDGGIDQWKKEGNATENIISVSANQLEEKLHQEDIQMLDVRKPSEYEAEHAEEAISFPLDFIHQNLSELDKNKHYYINCKSGYRSMVASSILKSNGYNIVDVKGGFEAILQTAIPKTKYVCPSTF